MARRSRIHRRVEVDVWSSPSFRALSAPKPNAQTLWLWLLTCERTVIIPGVVVARPAVMADDLRWPRRGFDAALAELESAGMIEVDREAGLVVLTRALLVDGAPRDGAAPNGENAAKSWSTTLLRLPPCPLRDVLAERVRIVISSCGGKIASAFTDAMVMASADHSDANRKASVLRDQGSGIRDQRERDPHPSLPLGPAPSAPAEREGTQTQSRDRSRSAAPAAPAAPGYQAVVARFDSAYRAQNGGAKPTWGDKPGAQLKRLIAQHGADEVLARIDRLFGGALASWCHPPYDVGTLVAQFDRLAVVTAPPAPPARSGEPVQANGLPPGWRTIGDEVPRRPVRREPISFEAVEREKAAAAERKQAERAARDAALAAGGAA